MELKRIALCWVLLCGFTHPNRAQLEEAIESRFQIEREDQLVKKSELKKYGQVIASPEPLPDGSMGKFGFSVDEYVGPEGMGYVLCSRIQQPSCPERVSGEPCVWEYCDHVGPEVWRDASEKTWRLLPDEDN